MLVGAASTPVGWARSERGSGGSNILIRACSQGLNTQPSTDGTITVSLTISLDVRSTIRLGKSCDARARLVSFRTFLERTLTAGCVYLLAFNAPKIQRRGSSVLLKSSKGSSLSVARDRLMDLSSWREGIPLRTLQSATVTSHWWFQMNQPP